MVIHKYNFTFSAMSFWRVYSKWYIFGKVFQLKFSRVGEIFISKDVQQQGAN